MKQLPQTWQVELTNGAVIDVRVTEDGIVKPEVEARGLFASPLPIHLVPQRHPFGLWTFNEVCAIPEFLGAARI